MIVVPQNFSNLNRKKIINIYFEVSVHFSFIRYRNPRPLFSLHIKDFLECLITIITTYRTTYKEIVVVSTTFIQIFESFKMLKMTILYSLLTKI